MRFVEIREFNKVKKPVSLTLLVMRSNIMRALGKEKGGIMYLLLVIWTGMMREYGKKKYNTTYILLLIEQSILGKNVNGVLLTVHLLSTWHAAYETTWRDTKNAMIPDTVHHGMWHNQSDRDHDSWAAASLTYCLSSDIILWVYLSTKKQCWTSHTFCRWCNWIYFQCICKQ